MRVVLLGTALASLAIGAMAQGLGGGTGGAIGSPPAIAGLAYLTPDQYGASPSLPDNAQALNAWLVACVAQQVICYAPTPVAGPYMASAITVPGPVIMQGSGRFQPAGVFHPVFKQKSSTNADFIIIATGMAGQRPMLRDLAIDGNSSGNSAGHTVSLPDDPSAGYGMGVDLDNVHITNCAQDCLNIGLNRGAGKITRSVFAHAANNGVTQQSSDWRMDGTDIGSAVNIGLSIVNGANFQVIGGGIFSNRIGVSMTRASIDPGLEMHGVAIDNNQQGGVVINTGGLCVGVGIFGGRLSGNSLAGTGTYSDILLQNTCGTVIVGSVFAKLSGQSKYLIETSVPAGPVSVSSLSYDWANAGNHPYAVASTNDLTNVPLPH